MAFLICFTTSLGFVILQLLSRPNGAILEAKIVEIKCFPVYRKTLETLSQLDVSYCAISPDGKHVWSTISLYLFYGQSHKSLFDRH